MAVVSEVLKGINFPADKQQIIDYTKKRNQPDEVTEALNRMPNDKYYSMAGVWHAIGIARKEGKMPGLVPKQGIMREFN